MQRLKSTSTIPVGFQRLSQPGERLRVPTGRVETPRVIVVFRLRYVPRSRKQGCIPQHVFGLSMAINVAAQSRNTCGEMGRRDQTPIGCDRRSFSRELRSRAGFRLPRPRPSSSSGWIGDGVISAIGTLATHENRSMDVEIALEPPRYCQWNVRLVGALSRSGRFDRANPNPPPAKPCMRLAGSPSAAISPDTRAFDAALAPLRRPEQKAVGRTESGPCLSRALHPPRRPETLHLVGPSLFGSAADGPRPLRSSQNILPRPKSGEDRTRLFREQSHETPG